MAGVVAACMRDTCFDIYHTTHRHKLAVHPARLHPPAIAPQTLHHHPLFFHASHYHNKRFLAPALPPHIRRPHHLPASPQQKRPLGRKPRGYLPATHLPRIPPDQQPARLDVVEPIVQPAADVVANFILAECRGRGGGGEDQVVAEGRAGDAVDPAVVSGSSSGFRNHRWMLDGRIRYLLD